MRYDADMAYMQVYTVYDYGVQYSAQIFGPFWWEPLGSYYKGSN